MTLLGVFSMADTRSVRKIASIIRERIQNVHVGCFEGMEKPLFLISSTYPGVWLEHVYDSLFYARLTGDWSLAKNTLSLFIDGQTDKGQLPCYVWDPARAGGSGKNLVGYSQTQECVSFAELCLEYIRGSGDREFLPKAYAACSSWENWYRTSRMTTNRGLVEMFVGYDTGHDNSGRLLGMACPGNYVREDGTRENAAVLPPEDGVTPILAVDMNCNFYATEMALAGMAEELGKPDEAALWRKKAEEVKKRLFDVCYDEKDAFFYDVDKNNEKRRVLSSTILHLFLEKVLDKEEDQDLIRTLLERHVFNPKEFWTAYPFPSVAVSDPTSKEHTPANSWGYFSEGLIALRATRWMDDYGLSKEFDLLAERWVDAWTRCYDDMKLAQELDPMTGLPSPSSEWYSSTMLFYLYAAERLGYIPALH